MTDAAGVKPLILFVDDERLPNIFYVNALEDSGYEVCFVPSISDAFAFVRSNKDRVRLAIIDLMMPSLDIPSAETEHGMLTGLYFYEWLKDYCPTAKVMFLSNNSEPRFLEQLPKEIPCYAKTSMSPQDLLECINEEFGFGGVD